MLRAYLADGWSQSDIARWLGVNRRTVYRWIQSGCLDRELDEEQIRYGPREVVRRKIDPYRGIIQTRLGECPKLSAVRLLEECRAAGYDGGYTQVKEFVRELRGQIEPEPVVRFETPPGHQAQVDFAEFKTDFGKRFALLVVLGYSRALWVRFYSHQTMDVLMSGLEDAFAFFGGVPVEVLFDQMKAVINSDLRDAGGTLKTNVRFARFAAHYGFCIRACRPYRAQTKGKVERMVSYLRGNFFCDRRFIGDDDLNAQLAGWIENEANVRVHGTTKERPVDRLQRDELQALGRLPRSRFPRLGLRDDPKPSQRKIAEVQRRALSSYDAMVGRSA